MTFMRKFLDMLNMDNWEKRREIESDTEKLMDEAMSLDESIEVTEEEIIESFKKQYYIVEENPQQDVEFDKCDENIPNEEISESEAYAEINRAKRLADIINRTTDREEFYSSLSEIENILTKLLKYENKYSFLYSPSANLRELRDIKQEQIELLEKRIAERGQKNDIEPITNLKFYEDKFYEEYRPPFRKTIAFIGNNFSEPEIEICSALIISGSRKGQKIKPNEHYSYFESLYGVVNIRKLHIWLYENGYLRQANVKEALNLYKVPELKMMLDSMGLKKNGNKPDLIGRIAENIDNETSERLSEECDRYFQTEKGKLFLEENEDYILFHENQYGVTFQEFCNQRILYGRKRKFYDTIYQVLSQKAFMYQTKGYISQLEMIYHNLSNSLYDEGKYELSLQNTLYRLYFSTNLSSKYYLFSLGNVKFKGIETAKERITSEETFNPYTISRIIELQPYFREQMLDIVYTPEILPYCLFGKNDMLDVILDLYDNTFDAEFYTNYIRINYGNYIKMFL